MEAKALVSTLLASPHLEQLSLNRAPEIPGMWFHAISRQYTAAGGAPLALQNLWIRENILDGKPTRKRDSANEEEVIETWARYLPSLVDRSKLWVLRVQNEDDEDYGYFRFAVSTKISPISPSSALSGDSICRFSVTTCWLVLGGLLAIPTFHHTFSANLFLNAQFG